MSWSLRTVQSTKAILQRRGNSDRVLVCRAGLMELSTKASGVITKLTVKVNFGMQMVMSTMVNGLTIKLTVTVPTCM